MTTRVEKQEATQGAPEAPAGGAVRKFGLLLLTVLFPLYLLTIGGEPSLDAESAHFGGWRLAETGTPWIEDQDFLVGHEVRDVWVTHNGDHEVVSRAPGVVALSAPAYFLAWGHDFSNLPGGVTAAAVTALGMLFFYMAFATRVSPRTAFWAALVLGLGTPVWSVAADAVWPHTLTVCAIGGMAWASATGRWWLVGIFGGMGLWGRSHFTLVVACVGLGVALMRRRPSIAAKVAVPSLALLVLMLFWTRWVFGAWRLTGSYQLGGAGDLTARYPNLLTNELGLFFALERGIFAWTPLLLVLAPAVVRGWRSVADWAKVMAAAGLVYTLAQGYAQVFHGGDSYWGYRLGLEFVACVAPAVVMSLQHCGRWARAVLAPLALWQMLVIALGATTGAGGAGAQDAWWSNSVATVAVAAPGLVVALGLAAVLGGEGFRRALTRRRNDSQTNAAG